MDGSLQLLSNLSDPERKAHEYVGGPISRRSLFEPKFS